MNIKRSKVGTGDIDLTKSHSICRNNNKSVDKKKYLQLFRCLLVAKCLAVTASVYNKKG